MNKKLVAILSAVCMLVPGTVHAAAWSEGRSAAQPYAGVPEVDLNTTMGYFMMYPREKMPAEHYCDVLEIYLPREDVELQQGFATIHDGEGNTFASIDFSDVNQVTIRPLDETELQGLMWGGGVCVEMRMPVSLDVGGTYYVTMDSGCFTAANGAVASLPIESQEAWVPVVSGDFGVSGLYYSKGSGEAAAPAADTAETTGDAAAEEAAPAEEAQETEETGEVEYVLDPVNGDEIHFNLTIGGEAAAAVIFSENGSVEFPETEYKASASIKGKVVSDDVDWGVIFLNDAGDALYMLDLGR